MSSKRSFSFALAALAVFGSALYAKADTPSFALDQTKAPTNFAAGLGVGQAVYATANEDVDSFGFFLDQSGGGNVNFFIYDATTSSLTLAPEAVAAPSSNKDWTYLTGLDVELAAGNTYYFGVYGNGSMSIGLDRNLLFDLQRLGIENRNLILHAVGDKPQRRPRHQNPMHIPKPGNRPRRLARVEVDHIHLARMRDIQPPPIRVRRKIVPRPAPTQRNRSRDRILLPECRHGPHRRRKQHHRQQIQMRCV